MPPTLTVKAGVIGKSVPAPIWTTNIVGTNTTVCGVINGKEVCFTNPPPPRNLTMMTLAWKQPGWTNGFPVAVYDDIWWAPNPHGPWINAFTVLVTNTNMLANVTIDLSVPAVFFRLGTNHF